ncbi:MAG: nucleotidyltransferase family protein [Candidatus Omnitrophota bacterium]|nr:MAG: nucleotidyltransferase family protein [Candidatus Omnitrophota bacterium]
MRVIILAAGYGTRLYPLTLDLPKPLICINNKPIINFLIDKIEDLRNYYSIEETKLVSNNKFYNKFLAWKKEYKVEIQILNDGSTSPEDRLGAVRDIKFAIDGKGGDWLVLGGDNLFEDNLRGFLEFGLKKKPYPCIGIYDVKDKSAACHYGVTELDSGNQIVSFEEKPKNPKSTLAATCVYFFPQDSLKLFDSFFSQVKASDASGEYIKWMVDKTRVYGYIFEKKWFDIGGSDALKMAEKTFM